MRPAGCTAGRACVRACVVMGAMLVFNAPCVAVHPQVRAILQKCRRANEPPPRQDGNTLFLLPVRNARQSSQRAASPSSASSSLSSAAASSPLASASTETLFLNVCASWRVEEVVRLLREAIDVDQRKSGCGTSFASAPKQPTELFLVHAGCRLRGERTLASYDVTRDTALYFIEVGHLSCQPKESQFAPAAGEHNTVAMHSWR